MELFSRFGTRLDEETKKKLERGKRIREVLKQQRLRPLSVFEQMAFLMSLTEGLFDPIPLEAIANLKQNMLLSIKELLPELRKKMNH